MLTLWLASRALAADPVPPALDAQLYRLPLDSEELLWTETSVVGPGTRTGAGLTAVLTRDPLVFRADDGDRVGLLENALQFDLDGYGSTGRVLVGFHLPVYALASSDLYAGGPGIGDASLGAKGMILGRSGAPVGLAATGRITLPSGTVDAPLSAGNVRGEVGAAVDRVVGPVLLAMNVGGRIGPRTEFAGLTVDDALLYRVGSAWAATPSGTVSLDVAGEVGLPGGPGASPVEVLAGTTWRVHDLFVVRGGAGTGLLPGYGAPLVRVAGGIAYQPARDADGDGLTDGRDRCRGDAEDPDGHEDGDGCPDPDNDGDGVLDAVDACALEAEDVDGWDDADGCADPATEVTVSVAAPGDAAILGLSTRFEHAGTVFGAAGTASLHPAVYRFVAEAPGWTTISEDVEVPAGVAQLTVAWDLVPAGPLGMLVLQVMDVAGNAVDAEFSVADGEYLPVPSGEARVWVAPGDHKVTVRAPLYQPVEEAVKIDAERGNNLVVLLEAAPR